MKLLTEALKKQLIANWNLNADGEDLIDFKPVVKIFNPIGAATWLLTEMKPDEDIAFGLCDLGQGFPELGYVSLSEMESYRGVWGTTLERDLGFKPDKTISQYADEARIAGRIVT